MKRIVCFLALLGAFMAVPAQAQRAPLTAAGCKTDEYNVQNGDRLYVKYGPAWERLLEVNPGLDARVTRRSKDQVIVRLYPSLADVLCIPAGMTALQIIGNATTPPVSAPSPAPEPELKADVPAVITAATPLWYDSPWLWIPLFIVVLILGLLGTRAWRRRREKEERDRATVDAYEREVVRPVESAGIPMVQGGIPPTEGARLTNFFDEQARMRFVELRPNYPDRTARPELLGSIEHGQLSGEGEVRDIHGRWYPRRVTTPQRAYQARFRYPDGTEEIMQAYETCMNIVRAGEGMRGFTFVRNADVVQPQPSPQLVPHPAVAVRAARVAAEAEGATTLLVGGKIMTVERGVHIDLDSVPGSAKVSGAAFEMTVKARKPRKAVVAARKTGTS